MHKKILALLAALVMMVAALPAMATELTDEQKIEQLANTVQVYIDSSEFTTFEYDSQKEQFAGLFELDSTLGECDVYIDIYYDMVAVNAVPSLRVPEEYRANVAVFINMANYREYYSYFRMDPETGYVYSRGMQLVENAFPTTDEIDVLLTMAVLTLDDYGNGLSKVAMGADPVETFNATVEEIKAKDAD